MASCGYCHEQADATIPANPGRVCVTHAIAFWTDYLAFSRKARLEGIEESDRITALTLRRRQQRAVGATDRV